MSSPIGKTAKIAIVGMGAVGTTTCTLLIKELLNRKGFPAVQIHTFEKTSSIDAGLAYSTKHDFHVLNMRAKTMSLFLDVPADFTNWLRSRPAKRVGYPARGSALAVDG